MDEEDNYCMQLHDDVSYYRYGDSIYGILGKCSVVYAVTKATPNSLAIRRLDDKEQERILALLDVSFESKDSAQLCRLDCLDAIRYLSN